MIENPLTGERISFVAESPELLVMDNVWPPGRRRGGAHVHPAMEERWEVLSGRAAFRIGGDEREAGVGESVTAPAGVAHEAWNPTEAEVRVRIERRPARRWRAFVERLCAGEDVVALLREFPDEVAPPPAG